MMAATQVSAGAASSGYYKSEGYYAAGTEEAEGAAKWFGELAADLGLEGNVDDALFSSLLEGQSYEKVDDKLVKGALRGKIVDGERKHRPGLDLTFSAPKSVSIAALVYGDKRLIEAHNAAVKVAMTHIEKELVQTRTFKNGALTTETGGKIIAGLFLHDTSRALDPQLHTHAVIANMVGNASGGVTALHDARLFRSQKTGSAIYRNELAKGAHDLGYTVDRVGPDKLVSLREVPQAEVDAFSKRSKEMEASLDKMGMSKTPKTAEMAALATRAAKVGSVDRNELREHWISQVAELGRNRSQIEAVRSDTARRAVLRLPGVTREGVPSSRSSVAVTKAVSHVSELKTTYTQEEIVTAALEIGKTISLSEAETAFLAATKTGAIIPVKVSESEDMLFTDAKSLKTEREVSQLYRLGSKSKALKIRLTYGGGDYDRRSPQAALNRFMDKKNLVEGQKSAVVTAVEGRGRIVGVQGDAGTGKTYTLGVIQDVLTQSGYTVEGLAPTVKATSELKEAIPNSETVQARLLRGRSANANANSQKTVLVVDEAGMLSTEQMKGVLRQAIDENMARVLLVGDTKQLDSIQAGTPFHLLQNLGMPTARMDDNRRVNDENTLGLVNAVVARDIQTAFEKLDGRISETEDIAETTAARYLSLTPSERETTAFITLSNKTRSAITQGIREGLRDEGKLQGNDTNLSTLNGLHFTAATAAEAGSYQHGDVVVAHATVKDLGLQKGHQYEVVNVDLDANKLGLQDQSSGKEFELPLNQGDRSTSTTSVYSKEEKDFSPGDEVRFRIADKASKINNGDTATIKEIDGEQISFVMPEGKLRSLDRDTLAVSGLDHSYTSTIYQKQGETVDNVVVAMSSTERLADQKGFYVAVSRARDGVDLITNNAAQLASRLEAQTGEKVQALEAYVAEKLGREAAETVSAYERGTAETRRTAIVIDNQDKRVLENLANTKAPDREDLAQHQLGDKER